MCSTGLKYVNKWKNLDLWSETFKSSENTQLSSKCFPRNPINDRHLSKDYKDRKITMI